MRSIYHILSSDIPHHNQTLLSFFQKELLPQSTIQQHFFYVVGDSKIASDFPTLAIQCFPTKKDIATALIAKKRQNPTAYFILHGQFNLWIWIAILLGRLSTENLAWHIWGADLYEESTKWAFKLFYPLRRLAQKRINQVWATRGDLDYFWRNVRIKSEWDQCLYFPTRLPSIPKIEARSFLKTQEKFTILLGNSGDPSNHHLTALANIQQTLGQNVRIIIPMGYPQNNERYIQQVEKQGKRLFFEENLHILRESLDFNEYIELLKCCDIGYFHFERQQGIGTICLLTQLNIPCVLHVNNPFCLDMKQGNIPFLFCDQLSADNIRQTKQSLQQLDKQQIPFFPIGYTKQWIKLLSRLT